MGRSLAAFLLLIFVASTGGHAQNETDVVRYIDQMQQAGPLNTAGLGADLSDGYAGLLINPAASALIEGSFMSLSLANRNVQQDVTYLAQRNTAHRNATGIGELTMALKARTMRGSLVFGAALNQLQDFTRINRADVFNASSTLLDDLNSNLFYSDIAFESYALDTLNGVSVPIWRTARSFSGIQQRVEVLEQGQMMEGQVFFGTEFLKGLYLGASFNLPFGNYLYERNFLEIDLDDRYNDIDQNNDVSEVASYDRIETQARGLYLRLGMVYRAASWLEVSGTWQSRTVMRIEEEFYSRIQTVFDNQDRFDADLGGDQTYKVRVPSRYNLGLAIRPLRSVWMAGRAEFVNYANGEIDFGSNLFDPETRELENGINQGLANDFENIIRWSGSLTVQPSEAWILRASGGYYPSPRSFQDRSLTLAGAGFSYLLIPSVWLDAGAQIRWFDDVNTYYVDFETDPQNPSFYTSRENVSAVYFSLGLRFSIF